MQVKVKILDPKAVIPVKSHDDDFCYDNHWHRNNINIKLEWKGV